MTVTDINSTVNNVRDYFLTLPIKCTVPIHSKRTVLYAYTSVYVRSVVCTRVETKPLTNAGKYSKLKSHAFFFRVCNRQGKRPEGFVGRRTQQLTLCSIEESASVKGPYSSRQTPAAAFARKDKHAEVICAVVSLHDML
jgi:hypothetical protein